LNLTILTSLLVVIIIIINTLRQEGKSWMVSTGEDLVITDMYEMENIATVKASFISTYFEQMELDVLVTSGSIAPILEGGMDISNPLKSFSMDDKDSLHNYPNSTLKVLNKDIIGYFDSSCLDCEFVRPVRKTDNCALAAHSYSTNLTSLMDFKLKSLSHASSIVSFVQMGLGGDLGYLFQYPYTLETLSHNSKCFVQDSSTPNCANILNACNLVNSEKGGGAAASFPPYDPRCRNWYNIGMRFGSPDRVNFLYPRISSIGAYVITAINPIRSDKLNSGKLLGVLNFNFDVIRLSTAINQNSILKSGYVYLIDATNVTRIVLHPRAPLGCLFVSCAESFAGTEYNDFESNVLLPLQNIALKTPSSNQVRPYLYSFPNEFILLLYIYKYIYILPFLIFIFSS